GQLKAKGANLAETADYFRGPWGELPVLPSKSFEFVSDLDWDQGVNSLQSITLTLGNLKVIGNYISTDGEGRLDLSANRMDLDRFLAVNEEGDVAEPYASLRISLPQNVTTRVTVTVDSLYYRNRLVRNVRLNGDLAEGVFTVRDAGMSLPGGSSLRMQGEVRAEGGEPVFAGGASLGSNNFRETIEWLGADLSIMPSERLRRAEFESRFELKRSSLSLTNLEGRIDGSAFGGALAIVFRDRPGLGINLKFQRLETDNYFPLSSLSVTTEERDEEADPRLLHLLSALRAVDANFRVSFDAMGLGGGASAQDVVFEGSLNKGTLILAEASAGKIWGGNAAYQGQIDLTGAGARLDGHFALVLDKPEIFSRHWRLGWPIFRQNPGYTLLGSVEGTAKLLNISGALQEESGEIAFAGEIHPLESKLRLSVDLVYESSLDLFARLGMTLPAGTGEDDPILGGAEIFGQFEADAAQWKFHGLQARLGVTGFQGRIAGEDLDDGGLAWEAELDADTLPISYLGILPFIVFQGDSSVSLYSLLEDIDGKWSRRPFDSTTLTGYKRGKLTFSAKELVWSNGGITDLELLANLGPKSLEVESLTGRIGDGTLIVSGMFGVEPRPNFKLTATGLDMTPSAIGSTAGEFGAPSGSLSMNLRLEGSGASPNELVENLTGNGEVSGSFGFIAWPRGAIRRSIKQELGQSALNIEGFGATLDDAEAAFGSHLGQISGRMRVDAGIMKLTGLRYLTDGFGIFGEGLVNIPRWKIESNFDLVDDRDPDSPRLSLEWRGRLDTPDLRLTGTALSRTEPEALSAP
ncbi:MAG: hypothetical protein R3245_01095, partial [Kiloniellales bacterium]|nr:hypothetical protein [Kiloniellales bacterium]